MGKREREIEEHGRELTRGERAYQVAIEADRKLARLVGRCTVFCGDVECPKACTNR